MTRSMPCPMVTGGLPAGATGLYEAFVPRRGPADSQCRARGRLLQQTERRAYTLPGSLRSAARILLPRDEVITQAVYEASGQGVKLGATGMFCA